LVNNVIYQELCLGIISPQSKENLIQQEDTALPVFDTTGIHATRAAMMSIAMQKV